MNQTVFRKKSIERVSSPEQLDAYIRVANPGVWMILAAIVILLIGVCVWGIFGHLETTVSCVAVSRKTDVTTLYVKEADVASMEAGMIVRVDGEETSITEIGAEPVMVDVDLNDSLNEYALHVGELKNGEWVFPVTVEGVFPVGVHHAEVVVETVTAISFLFN